MEDLSLLQRLKLWEEGAESKDFPHKHSPPAKRGIYFCNLLKNEVGGGQEKREVRGEGEVVCVCVCVCVCVDGKGAEEKKRESARERDNV